MLKYNNIGDAMFKKFYIYFFISLSIFTVLFSSNNTNKKSYSSTSDLFFPIFSHNFSSYYGYRDLMGQRNFHDGLDIPAPSGTPIYATDDGVIINSSFIRGYGNCIIILHNDGKKSLYGHLSENFIVGNGTYVKKGQNIGYVGPKYLSNGLLNGYTTGTHLHFSIFLNTGKTTNPLDFNYIKN